MKPTIFIIGIFFTIVFVSCGTKQIQKDNNEFIDTLITITRQQFETDKMAIGKLTKMPFIDAVKCNGKIVAKPTGTAKVAAMVPGLVQKINCSIGQHVIKGQVLFELTGNELIELQREFAESASQLHKLQSEYERIKSLYNENVGTQKELISAESEFKSVNARYAALKLKIGLIGLDYSKVEKGEFYTVYAIKSPINGFIAQIYTTIGQHADEEILMAEVIDAAQFHLQLSVFEKDINRLVTGQKIQFSMLNDLNAIYQATLQIIGKTVDPDTKSISCYAAIDKQVSRNFVNNEYIEAQIVIHTDTVFAAEAGAILKSEGNHYLLKMVNKNGDNFLIDKVIVNAGRLIGNYVEIIDPEENENYIISGAYNVVLK